MEDVGPKVTGSGLIPIEKHLQTQTNGGLVEGYLRLLLSEKRRNFLKAFLVCMKSPEDESSFWYRTAIFAL